MTKFEQIGVNRQYDSDSKHEATRAFNRSCEVCCNKGMHITCEKCSIAYVHSLVIATFEEQKGA